VVAANLMMIASVQNALAANALAANALSK